MTEKGGEKFTLILLDHWSESGKRTRGAPSVRYWFVAKEKKKVPREYPRKYHKTFLLSKTEGKKSHFVKSSHSRNKSLRYERGGTQSKRGEGGDLEKVTLQLEMTSYTQLPFVFERERDRQEEG